MNRKTLLFIFLLPTIVALQVSCTPTAVSIKPGYVEEDKKATAKAIDEFHARMNAGQADQIYKNASEFFRRAQDQATMSKAMQDTRSQFGNFEQVTSSELNVIIGSPVQIRAVYHSHFQKGDATELFIFVKQQDEVQLMSYQILAGTVQV